MPLSKIKSAILHKKIRNESGKSGRNKALIPWDSVKTIGVMYVVPEEAGYVRFTNFISSIQAEKKEVRTLGYCKSKLIPHYCYPRLAFDYFTPKDINWFGKPGGPKVNDFMGSDFDVLINLDLSGKSTFDYISCNAKARLKTGLYREESVACYDFMIRMNTPDHPEELMAQIISWLRDLKH